MKRIKILIADDHKLIRDGIKAMLLSSSEFEIVGEAKDGREVIEKTKRYKPDVVIMDIAMPALSGIEATKIIKKLKLKTNILVLSQYEDNEYIYQILKTGATTYLLKNIKKEEFISAIHLVAKGGQYFSKEISELIIEKYMNREESKKNRLISGDVPLSKRENEIIKLIAKEHSNQEIAGQLNISKRTVETHRRNIMQKLKIKSTVALVKYALKNQIISLE